MPESFPPQFYRQIIDQAPDAVLFSDREGIIRLWNRGCELVFGYSAAEALGQSLDLIIPERLRGRHWEGYWRVMETGETRYGTDLLSVPALHRDGHQLSCAFSIVMLKDEQGMPLGVASIMRDVTAAFDKEKALKKRIAELELAQATGA
ncbi:signal transduction histidine kinase [Desulfuromonas versatilis]|uniref:Signal transduction histidine kinase n=1 Tax=Desulfuromonas versatilis TaxID=2802975 RepID=A0ABN6E084_9BACT|nr:PAS domain S-box protein [Desulfuromonas versatilis]BCR04879.1 signal transduction histidine kinase [Desulfuromonas versatilis]